MLFVCRAAAALAACCLTFAAHAGSIEKSLLKLDPEERSHQACIIAGLDVLRHDPRLSGADRLKTSIFSRAVLSGTSLTAKGGAVRARGRWYAVTFTCNLTPDLMKATSFKFKIGEEIPKTAWDRYGLWG
jgi:hypothetical protein